MHPFTVPGYWRQHVHKGDVGNTGSPIAWSVVTTNLRPVTVYGVAERPVLLEKLGNAGGGKGPWFETGTESREAREIGVTL